MHTNILTLTIPIAILLSRPNSSSLCYMVYIHVCTGMCQVSKSLSAAVRESTRTTA